MGNKGDIGSNIKMQKLQNNEISSSSSLPMTKTKGHKFRSWFFGILLLAGVIAAATHLGEIEHFAKLAREAKPKWLLVMLLAMGQDVSFLVAFPSFVVSSIIATLSPIPLGLGVFEASSTGMLSALGIPVEAALTSTLLLRGFTLWLPMLPGLWLAKRQLR